MKSFLTHILVKAKTLNNHTSKYIIESTEIWYKVQDMVRNYHRVPNLGWGRGIQVREYQEKASLRKYHFR